MGFRIFQLPFIYNIFAIQKQNVRFLILNQKEFSISIIKFYMKKILLLALVGLIAVGAQSCLQGQLKIDGACRTISYIAGCVQYSGAATCNICQYGYQIADGKCQYSEKPTSECCISKDDNGACLQCAPGLYKDGNSCLKIERPGCLEGSGLKCSNCASGYQNINGRCYRQIASCSKYDERGICSQCQTGYELIRNLCSAIITTPVVQNCKISNEYGCVSCSAGFYLTRDRTCSANAVGCVKYYRQKCQLCSIGFKLINGKCLMDGCSLYGLNGCTGCVSPYTLTADGRCAIDNCLQSLDGQCLVCHSEYRIKNGKCVKPIADRCTNCANGYFVGQDGKCYRTIVGCSDYSTDGRCVKCVEPFMTNGGACVIQGCQRTGVQGCQSCFKPFQLSAGRCVLDFCIDYNYQTRKCRSCKLGYHLQSGLCVKNNPICQTYMVKGDDQVCSVCISDNYVLTETGDCVDRKPGCVYQYGKCISCAFPFKRASDLTCYIEGCAKYSFDGCIQCNYPYQERRGVCVVANCEEVVNGKCTRCSSGYHLTSKGLCAEDDPKCAAYTDDKCSKCISGYKFNSQGVCVRQIPFCRRLGYDRCQQCQSGYQLVYGQCVITDRYCQAFDGSGKGCARCTRGYHTQSGICRLDEPSCAQYSAAAFTQKCVKCALGFVFAADGTKCIKSTPGCIYDGKGVCVSCRQPFKYNGKTCVISGCAKYSEAGCYECDYPFLRDGDRCVIAFCDLYDMGAAACSKCMAGYKLIQGKCFREDPKCVEYTKLGVCTACIKEYTVFQGVCVKEDSNCFKYSKLGGCNKCKDRYYLSPDSICLPEQPGCVYQNGKCTYCNYPFKFNDKAQKCRIEGCNEADYTGCTQCKYPFEKREGGLCGIPNCATVQDNHCVRCTPGYHLKQGLTCAKDDISCLKYNEDGDCEACDKGYMLMSSGECEVAEDNCIEMKKQGQCLACKDEYFLNKFFQCQKKDVYCEQYNNGVCTRCDNRHFLWELICFPYSPGCVQYKGKDCIKCKTSWSLRNGECFNLKKPGLKLQGEDEKYDFEITPIDITKSKYYIDNLSPVSKLGKVFYSSFSVSYTDPRPISEDENLYPKGWKAENPRDGQYIGYIIEDTQPVTFYAIQMEAVQGNYIRSFYIEYSVDGINYIRIEKLFDSEKSSKGLTTIYFTGVYAKAIRIVVKSYYGWPATRIEFFYYDTLRFRKISNLKSLKYLQESIQSNFVDRMDNQMYINQRTYFNPAKTCLNPDVCFTGLQLCQARTIDTLTVSATSGVLKKIYITYSIDGRSFNCFQKCRHVIMDGASNVVILNHLLAKNVRVYPVEWTGTPSLQVTYDYA